MSRRADVVLRHVKEVLPTTADLPSPSSLKPRRLTPMSQLSWPRKLRRLGGALALVSTGALVVSAATASSDWNIEGDGPPS